MSETVKQEAAWKLDIASQTDYRWRKEYGDMNTTQVRKLRDLENENLAAPETIVDVPSQIPPVTLSL